MKTVLCTLYNSLYLDKGLVLYDSLMGCCADFVLYVLCMDDKCYDVLSSINKRDMMPIKLKALENEELLIAKSNRSFGEYCWTITPSLIIYIIERYRETICTYVDADMFFYNDPQILIDEMISAKKEVLIVPHRFTRVNKHLERNGVYCVEFNTFTNDRKSLDVLYSWKKDCLGSCSINCDNKHFGDQKYLDSWPNKYETVFVCPHLGAGVAPWNIQSYKMSNYNKGENLKIIERKSGRKVDLIFYHFQHITYASDNVVKINVYTNKIHVDSELVNLLYQDYLQKIRDKKIFLRKEYGIWNMQLNHITDAHGPKPPLCSRLKQFSFIKCVNKMLYLFNKRKDYIVVDNI